MDWASVVPFARDCLSGVCEKAPKVNISPETFFHSMEET